MVNAIANVNSTPITMDPQGKNRFADILDGTSNTILHAEKYARCSNSTMVTPFQDGGTAWAYTTSPKFSWQPSPMQWQPPGKGFQPGFAIAALVAIGAPNAIFAGSNFQRRPRVDDCDPTRASTAHDTIVVGLVDGSVRTLSPSISGDAWWAAVTKDGNEPVSLD
jgi:hypothetical protein